MPTDTAKPDEIVKFFWYKEDICFSDDTRVEINGSKVTVKDVNKCLFLVLRCCRKSNYWTKAASGRPKKVRFQQFPILSSIQLFNSYCYKLQSDRIDFITFMLKANEINPNVSEQDSADSEHDEENIHQNPHGVEILNGLTMEVCKIIQFSIHFDDRMSIYHCLIRIFRQAEVTSKSLICVFPLCSKLEFVKLVKGKSYHWHDLALLTSSNRP